MDTKVRVVYIEDEDNIEGDLIPVTVIPSNYKGNVYEFYDPNYETGTLLKFKYKYDEGFDPQLLYTCAFLEWEIDIEENGKSYTEYVKYYHDNKTSLYIYASGISKNKRDKSWKSEIDRLFKQNKIPHRLHPGKISCSIK